MKWGMKMTKICKNCYWYWYKPNSRYSDKINCLNDFSKVNETDTCEDFILEEDAEMAQVVEAVAKEVKRKELDI